MLVMTCRIGSTVRIGPDIHLTLQARAGNRVTIELLTPADTPVRLDRVNLQPARLPSGACAHLFSLQGVRRFQVGTTEVSVWVPGEIEPLAAGCVDFVHLGLAGPASVQVSYEPSAGGPVPVLTYSASPAVARWH
jgi:hypothetical protein